MKRTCGSCDLCCTLLPVDEGIEIDWIKRDVKPMGWHKMANERCRHQKGPPEVPCNGCKVYGQSDMPAPCRAWNCAWLVEDGPARLLPKPNVCGYVVDTNPDIITVGGGPGEPPEFSVPCIQVWIDPKRRNAYNDAKLRSYIESRSRNEGGLAAMIRFNEAEGVILFPPHLTGKGWLERTGTNAPELTAKRHALLKELGRLP